MAETLQAQIEKLHLSINTLKAQRSVLGDAIVDPVLAASRKQLAEVLEALGEEQAAREALESGHQALMEKADSIGRPEWRQSFLENVPENRALMEIWERRKQ